MTKSTTCTRIFLNLSDNSLLLNSKGRLMGRLPLRVLHVLAVGLSLETSVTTYEQQHLNNVTKYQSNCMSIINCTVAIHITNPQYQQLKSTSTISTSITSAKIDYFTCRTEVCHWHCQNSSILERFMVASSLKALTRYYACPLTWFVCGVTSSVHSPQCDRAWTSYDDAVPVCVPHPGHHPGLLHHRPEHSLQLHQRLLAHSVSSVCFALGNLLQRHLPAIRCHCALAASPLCW